MAQRVGRAGGCGRAVETYCIAHVFWSGPPVRILIDGMVALFLIIKDSGGLGFKCLLRMVVDDSFFFQIVFVLVD